MSTLTHRLTASEAAADILTRLLPLRCPTSPSPIDSLVSNPWHWEVNHRAARGDFGYGKRLPDLYNRVGMSSRRSYKAIYNRYQPTAEEMWLIAELVKEGHTAMGISLLLADKLGKVIPIHVIRRIVGG